MVFNFLKKKSGNDDLTHTLYAIIVKQARKLEFYEDLGVPDTPDGRFDMILLHAYLLFRRLKDEDERAGEIAQSVFDLMFADMDQSLRELGVGDIGVSHRIKGMIKAFYGRVSVYEDGVGDVSNALLVDALKRNLYRKSDPNDEQVLKVAEYIRHEIDHLTAQDTNQILDGKVHFSSGPIAKEI